MPVDDIKNDTFVFCVQPSLLEGMLYVIPKVMATRLSYGGESGGSAVPTAACFFL